MSLRAALRYLFSVVIEVPTAEAASMELEPTGKRILIGESDPNLARIYNAQLRHDGYDTMTSADCLEILAMVRQRHPDVVILGCGLVRTRGIALLRRLVNQDRDLPVIVNTASRDPETAPPPCPRDGRVYQAANLSGLLRLTRWLTSPDGVAQVV